MNNNVSSGRLLWAYAFVKFRRVGAGGGSRTPDPLITNQLLYQLSYASPEMERETGIEPATNSLEGCDSTIELLPLEI